MFEVGLLTPAMRHCASTGAHFECANPIAGKSSLARPTVADAGDADEFTELRWVTIGSRQQTYPS